MPHTLGPIAALILAAVPSASSAVLTASGQVRFVTAKRIYLDKGAADGLQAGVKVTFARARRAVGGCTIDLVGAHDAVCRATGLLAGDVFVAPKRPSAAPRPAPAALPALEPAATLVRRAAAIAHLPQAKVDFVPQARSAYAATATVAAGISVYAARPGAPQYVMETLDVALHHVPLGESGLRFDTAFSIIRPRTASIPRFRPAGGTELYLWDAEISRREIDSKTVFAAGRIWPWHTPGLPILDGVQLGRRNGRGTMEGGAYGGLIPQTLTVQPSWDSWAGGLYGALAQPGARGDVIRMAQEEARIGMRHSSTVGWVREGEAQVAIDAGGSGIATSGRLRDAPEVDRQPVLELVNGEAWLRASTSVGTRVQVRYLGVAPEEEPLLRDEIPRVLGGYHGSCSFSWDPSRLVGAVVTGNAHHEQEGDLNEVNAGLDLHLPRLFGEVGGLWLGAAAGQGWMQSRSAYLQVILAASARLRFLGRFGGDISRFNNSVGAVAVSELGGSFQLDGRLTSRLRFVLRTLVRFPLAIEGLLPDTTAGLVSNLNLAASF
jgi:hypothetical protein